MFYFFELDLLRTMPGNVNMKSYARAHKPNVFAQNSTEFELSAVLDPKSYGNGTLK